MSSLYALIDCNNFYASCERAFRPDLRGKPIVVLSNNDGCIIARSSEAKALKIGMGWPYFKHKKLLKQHDVAVFSSNYALYGDMSARVMRVLTRFCPEVEVYSIDEAFVNLTGMPKKIERFTRRLRATVERWTGIPVSIGIGSSKTLAKLANNFAKKQTRCQGVFNLNTSPQPDKVLHWTPIENVWGIGRRHAKRLRKHGITNALEFRDLKQDWVKKNMTVTGVHTLLELRGFSCHDFATTPAPKKTIVSSRSFGKPITERDDLLEATAQYCTRAAEKLRRQQSVAGTLLVFLQTNPFKDGEAYYANTISLPLPIATAYTPILIQAAQDGLKKIYRQGYTFKKCGVILSGLEPANGRWLSLLDLPSDSQAKQISLMEVLDSCNTRWGQDTLKFAASGLAGSWQMRREMCSQRYTTAWKELLRVQT